MCHHLVLEVQQPACTPQNKDLILFFFSFAIKLHSKKKKERKKETLPYQGILGWDCPAELREMGNFQPSIGDSIHL